MISIIIGFMATVVFGLLVFYLNTLRVKHKKSLSVMCFSSTSAEWYSASSVRRKSAILNSVTYITLSIFLCSAVYAIGVSGAILLDGSASKAILGWD